MKTTNAVTVDQSNAEQLRAWDGDEGAYWAAHAEQFDRSIAAYHPTFMRAAGVGADHRVLDVGCGTGKVARDAARAAVNGSVLGVDLSSAMLAVARRLADHDQLGNVEFMQADAQVHPFEPGSFDRVLARTAAMFFGDKPAAFRNLAQALRPGGRMVLLTWQPLSENEWISELSGALADGRTRPAPPPDAPGPFSLSDPDLVRSLLADAGFSDVEIEGQAAGMWFGDNADGAFEFVSGLLGWMLEGLDAAGRGRALDALRSTIADHTTPSGVLYRSATWTITATKH